MDLGDMSKLNFVRTICAWGMAIAPRSRRRSRLQFVALFATCCLLAVSCGPRESAQVTQSPGEPGRITIGTIAKVRTLDPADAYENAAGTFLYNLGDRLYTYKTGTTQIEPQLATALPTIGEDGLTYTIPLREGVKFHDGTAFNAEAMKFSLTRFIENGGIPSSILGEVVEAIEATGEYELTVTLKKPFAAFTSLLTFTGTCAVSPQAYEIGDGKFQPDRFVGTGPYKLANYGTDSIQFDVFEDYWGEKPTNLGVDVRRYSSASNVYNALQTGAIDLTYGTLDLDQIAQLEKEAQAGKFKGVTGPGNGIYYLTLNLQSEPLNRPEVRQAIAAIVNRPLLQQRVFRGQIEPIYSLLPATLDEYYKPVFQTYGDGNGEKALALLVQAGYSQQNPLNLELWYRSNITSNGLVATTIKAAAEQQLKGFVNIELKSVESATAYQNLDKGVYPIFLLDWSPDFLDPDNYIQPFMDCDRGSAETGCQEGASKLQGSFYYSDRVNELIDLERQERDPAKRQAIFAELQDILARDVPFVPLWQSRQYLFAQPNLEGVALQPTQHVNFATIQE
jgi:peptide/nickel transport system substrate-binding protein